MQAALGIAGTEGAFRAAAEGTVHALRSSGTAQSELLRSHCQEPSLLWNAGHHNSALSKVLISNADDPNNGCAGIAWDGMSSATFMLLRSISMALTGSDLVVP